jgi:hypothetical protein
MFLIYLGLFYYLIVLDCITIYMRNYVHLRECKCLEVLQIYLEWFP